LYVDLFDIWIDIPFTNFVFCKKKTGLCQADPAKCQFHKKTPASGVFWLI